MEKKPTFLSRGRVGEWVSLQREFIYRLSYLFIYLFIVFCVVAYGLVYFSFISYFVEF